MITQHPIFLIIISLLTIILVIIESLQKDRLFRSRLLLSFLLLLFHILIVFVYEAILGNLEYEYIYLSFSVFTYLIFMIQFTITFYNSILKGKHYKLLINGIKENEINVFLVLDNKDRIKDISNSILEEFNLEREDVLNKKFFQIVNEKVRLTKMNQRDSDNKQVEKYFKSFGNQAKTVTHDELELEMLNFSGNRVSFKLLMQPVYSFGRLRGKVLIGEKATTGTLFEVEKNLRRTDSELDSIRARFITLLDVVGRDVFIFDLDREQIWFNYDLMNSLKFSEAEISIKDYYALVHKEDIDKYQVAHNGLNKSNDTYYLSYRILVAGVYIWVQEEGKRVFDDKRHAVIIGQITIMSESHFQKTGSELLDNIKTEVDLNRDLQKLVNDQRQFQLAIFKLENIPKINEIHGRTIGNFMMGSYIKKIQNVFITSSNSIYRVDGLKFAMTITEPNKMDSLHQGINNQKNYLNLEMTYGSINATLEVYVGVANMYSDAVNVSDLYQNAERALNVALGDNYKKQGCYFKDIK